MVILCYISIVSIPIVSTVWYVVSFNVIVLIVSRTRRRRWNISEYTQLSERKENSIIVIQVSHLTASSPIQWILPIWIWIRNVIGLIFPNGCRFNIWLPRWQWWRRWRWWSNRSCVSIKIDTNT